MAWYDYILNALHSAYGWWSLLVDWAGRMTGQVWYTFTELIRNVQDWFFSIIKDIGLQALSTNQNLGWFIYYWAYSMQLIARLDYYNAGRYLDFAVLKLGAFVGEFATQITNYIDRTVTQVIDQTKTIIKYVGDTIYYTVGVTETWVNQRLAALNIPSWVEIGEAINTAVADVNSWAAGVKEGWEAFTADPWGTIGAPVVSWFEGISKEFGRGFDRGFEEEMKKEGGSL